MKFLKNRADKSTKVNEKENLVSIIVPVYNVENYLEKCLDSILSQTYKNYELILINDGSTDSSATIIERYRKDSRISIISQNNMGLSEARNRGVQAAHGKYITFIDSDDWISKDYLENMIFCILKENADIVSMNYCVVKETKCTKSKRRYRVFEKNCADSLFGFKDNNYAWGKLIKTSIFKKYNINFPVGKHYEDIGTMYKIYDHCKKIVLSDKGMYFYLVRKNSITSKRSLSDVIDKIYFLNEMHTYQLSSNYKFWKLYISVKAFGAMADLYKISNLDIQRRNILQEKIYSLSPSVNLLSLKPIPVWVYIRAICMQIKIAHVLLKVKYRI